MAGTYDNPFALGLIKKFEGYTPKPKWDHKQYSTGYGTKWVPGQPMGTRADHDAALASEAGKVDSYIQGNVRVPLDEGKRAALTSFGYNLGPGAIQRLLPDINSGNWDRVGQRMQSFNKASGAVNPGLVDRRRQEVALLTGASPPSQYMAANASNEVANGAPMQQPIGGMPMQGGPEPLTPPNQRLGQLANAFMSQGMETKPQGWGDLIRGLSSMVSGSGYAQKADEQQKTYQGQLAKMLSGASGNADQLATTLIGSGDPQLVQQGVALKVAQAKPQAVSNDIQEYQFAMKQRQEMGQPVVAYGDWLKDVKAKQAESGYGTTANEYVDAQGVKRVYQLSKQGGRKDVEFPEGAKPIRPLQFVDTLDGVQPTDRGTAEPVGPAIPKNIAGKEAAEAVGKQAGAAQASLPSMKTTMDDAFRTIKELREHPGREAGTGLSSWIDPRNYFAGTDATDFAISNRKAKAKSFMAAREGLKGAGQVTDFEGGKGEDAIAALDAAQSDGQYMKALDDLERMMKASYDDLKTKAGMGGGAQAQTPAAQAQPAQPKAPPPEAIQMLRQKPSPETRQQFNEIFGPGAAEKALGLVKVTP